jgi:thymidylate synthase
LPQVNKDVRYLSAATLDDLLRAVFQLLLAQTNRVKPTRGRMAEVLGVLLELKDPRARLSRSEGRGKPFSCLGEFLWYLSRSNRLDFIQYYVPAYKDESDDGSTVHGGYGRRMFAMRGVHNQIDNVLTLLRSRPSSRRAVIQLFDAADLAQQYREVPCTCSLQFLIRNGRLHLIAHMRSNDAYLGLPHDVFAFTMIQEVIAVSLGVKLGIYRHLVGSLHLYDKHRKSARMYLKEGLQSHIPMPKMPATDPWSSIDAVLRAERDIRTDDRTIAIPDLTPYWLDLIRLLQIHKQSKQRAHQRMKKLKASFSSRVYDTYVSDVIQKIKGANEQTVHWQR